MPWFGGLLLGAGGLLLGVVAWRSPASSAQHQPADSSTNAADPANDSLMGGRLGLAAFILVTMTASMFRLPWLGQLPPELAADEASLGLDALDVLNAGWASASWNGWPVFHVATIGGVAAFGPTSFAIRLPSALAGVAFAPALFLLGRQIGGTRLGTVAGLLAAVLFWHADTSRGAWGYGIWGLTCETLGLALLMRTMRRPDPATTAAAGLAFGLALQVSWAALAAMGVGALLTVSAARRSSASPRALTYSLAPLLVYFAVAAGPIVIGMCIPDRPPAGLSTTTHESASAIDLVSIPVRLALLFNVAGDPSPLHGLRGEPLLDVVTGALLVLGIGIALARWRRPEFGALVAWFVAALILAAVVGRRDRPDSLTAIHVLAPALLLAATALSATAGGLWRRGAGQAGWPLDLTLLLIVTIVAINGHALYVRRPADAAAWSAYAAAEALAAREIRSLTSTHTIYLADVWIDHPTIRYLSQVVTAPRRLDPTTTLPFPRDEAFAYFAPGDQEVVAEDLERLYENGEIDRYRSPLDDSVVAVRSFQASAKVIAEARGVTLRATQTERSRTDRFTLQSFAVDWPVAGESDRPSTLDLFAAVSVVEPGVYRMKFEGPPGASLEVNDVPVAGPGEEVSVTLARGSQRLQIFADVDGPARIDLKWAPPGRAALEEIPADRLYREQRAAVGLLALYRSGTDPASPVELAQVERYLQRQESPPALSRPYVADWIGTVDAPSAGTYRFRLDASGPASLWLNDQPLLLGAPPNTGPVSVVLPDGDHRIQVRLVDLEAPTRLDLHWAPPGEDWGAIPTSRFEPPDAPVNAVHPLEASPDVALAPLGSPRVRWLASTEGEPRAVAVRQDSTVFITNVTARQVQQVVGEGRSVVELPAALSAPSDIEIGPDGRVWAIDALFGQIVRLDEDGNIDLSIENRDLGLYRPRGLAIAPDGTILVADTGGSRIVRLAGDGTFLDQIGSDVRGLERIRQPTDVAVGPDGELFVVNGEGGALLRLTADGSYLQHWTVLSAETERGAHLAIGPDRSVWVSEPEGRRVSRFTFNGTPAGVVDQTRAGRLLRVPVGIAVGPDGTLYIADASLRAVIAMTFDP